MKSLRAACGAETPNRRIILRTILFASGFVSEAMALSKRAIEAGVAVVGMAVIGIMAAQGVISGSIAAIVIVGILGALGIYESKRIPAVGRGK